MRRVIRYDYVRYLAGAVLLLAATLKTQQVAAGEIAAEFSLMTSRWAILGIVELELLLGLWLWAGFFPRVTWRLAVLAFVAFAVAAATMAVRRVESCGCFGAARVPPWAALSIDIGLLALLLGYGPPVRAAHGGARRVIFASALIAMVPITSVMAASYATAESTRVLRPGQWLGKTFPLLPDVEPPLRARLQRGTWRVLLVRAGCDRCRQAVLRAQAETPGDRGAPRLAVVELPSSNAAAVEPMSMYAPVWGVLDPAVRWVATTPCELELSEGVITRVNLNPQG